MRFHASKIYRSLAVIIPFLFIGIFVVPRIFTISNHVGSSYLPSDEEFVYMSSVSTARGEGLYEGFSHLYPPGRFLGQSIFLNTIGESLPTTRLYTHTFAPILFTFAFFWLAYTIFLQFGISQNRHLLSLAFASAALFMSHTIVHSAQEVHGILALFFVALLNPFKNKIMWSGILGFLFAAVYLFRFDAGILLTLALIISHGKSGTLYKDVKWKSTLLGFSCIWVPILLLITFQGSLINFLHDTLYLGLILQPQQMSLPIPSEPLRSVYLAAGMFTLGTGFALFKSSQNTAMKAFAALTALSYVSTLGRSDEAHLWYGLVWIPILIGYAVTYLLNVSFDWFNKREFIEVVMAGVGVYAFTEFILITKSPAIFILSTLLIFAAYKEIRINTSSMLIGTIIASLVFFHSVSYLKLRYWQPTFSHNLKFTKELFTDNTHEIAGLKFNDTDMETLSEIKRAIPQSSEYIFIYPNHVILYEYFSQRNPTRHYLFTGERSDYTENEILTSLENATAHNSFALVFTDHTVRTSENITSWLLDNTELVQTYMFNRQEVELRSF